eukprot:15003-Heterococcus_DN1.PRE.1
MPYDMLGLLTPSVGSKLHNNCESARTINSKTCLKNFVFLPGVLAGSQPERNRTAVGSGRIQRCVRVQRAVMSLLVPDVAKQIIKPSAASTAMLFSKRALSEIFHEPKYVVLAG